MTVGQLFRRKVAIEFGPPGGAGVYIDALRIAFQVDHKADRSPSTARIEIYNLAPTSLAVLQGPGAELRLYAGHEPIQRLLFRGQPIRGGISIVTDGADRIVRLEASDGGGGLTRNLAVTFSTASTFGQILDAVMTATGWGRGSIQIDESVALPSGVVLLGTVSEILDRIAATVLPIGAVWFVRDNALYIVPKGDSTAEVAPELSATTGNLIGSPTSTAEGIRCRALIDASMRPGRTFSVASQYLSGFYVAEDVSFNGDTHGTPFYMTIAGRPPGVP